MVRGQRAPKVVLSASKFRKSANLRSIKNSSDYRPSANVPSCEFAICVPNFLLTLKLLKIHYFSPYKYRLQMLSFKLIKEIWPNKPVVEFQVVLS